MDVLAVARPVVVQVQEGSGGASTESILVFVGGVLAAVAAVVAALISTRAASSRMEQQLSNERERSERQLEAERDRAAQQLSHERYLVRREEASLSIGGLARMVTRHDMRTHRISGLYLEGDEPPKKDLEQLREQLLELYEESNIVSIRFGVGSPVVEATLEVVSAFSASLPQADELPLSEARGKEIKKARKDAKKAVQHFLREARDALENYT
jgi:hypothetical protein